MNTTNPFDTNNLADLPNEVRANVKRQSRFRSENSIALVELFKIKNSLSIDEIIVGLYRLNKIKVNRRWVIYTLHNFILMKVLKKNKADKPCAVSYSLIEEGVIK